MAVLQRKLLCSVAIPIALGVGVAVLGGPGIGRMTVAQAQSANPCSPCGAASPGGSTDCVVPRLQQAQANPCAVKNPCAAKAPCAANPCAANPCAVKTIPQGAAANPCAAQNPCAAKSPCAAQAKPCNPCAAKKLPTGTAANPCAAKTPCGANPCAAANPCNPCAAKKPPADAANPCAAKNPCKASDAGFASFAVSLSADEIEEVGNTLREMGYEPGNTEGEIDRQAVLSFQREHGLKADGLIGKQTLAALETEVALKRGPCNPCAAKKPPASMAANPCAAQNPCAAKNPCAVQANPCAPKKKLPAGAVNPCAAQNPCAANPCAAKNPCGAQANPCNPCNPCGAAAAPDVTKEELRAVFDCLTKHMRTAYGDNWQDGTDFANAGVLRPTRVAYSDSDLAEAKSFLDWKNFATAPYTSATHGNRFVVNYANSSAEEAYGKYEQIGTMPEGGIIAKPSFMISANGQAQFGPLFLMEKMEKDWRPESRDWRYTMVMPDGTVAGRTQGPKAEAVEFCVGCHAGVADTQDSLFFIPEDTRVK